MKATHWTEEQGVTLVELAVAAGIFALSFVFLMGGLIEMNHTNSISEDQTICSAHLEAVAEEIQSLTYDELLQYQAPAIDGLSADSNLSVFAFRENQEPVRLPVNMDEFSGTLPNPLPLGIRALWTDQDGRPRIARVMTFHRR